MKIVIVGGVGGGMSAAARARRLDESAEIVVLDRSEHVSWASCGLPYHVGGEIAEADELLVQTPEKLRAALDLDVRTRHDVVGLDPEARRLTVLTDDGTDTVDYDALVLSPGAKAVRPPLDGIDSARVHTLRSIGDATSLRERIDAGAGRAVVLGAGFIGLEAAETLAARGLDVTVVELSSHVLPPLEHEVAWRVTAELERIGVTVRTGLGASSIEQGADHDTVVLADGTRLPADVVVLSVGVRPDTAVFEKAGIATERGAIVVDDHGRTSTDGIWAVGDAVTSTDAVTGVRRPVALAGPANRAGRLVADDILRPGSARPVPPTVGTAVVRVGEMTAAATGATRADLRAADVYFQTLHLHPGHHVGWFPGAEQIHMMIHFRAGDGVLLGAQAVGRAGVDKRIDVLATAVRAGMTVADLIDLDLAYAPPYGAAKDPVNLAGMAASNVLDGTLRIWHVDQLEEVRRDTLVLDVRSRDEFATGHIPGSLNIPHTELRERLDEVTAAASGHPVRVLCASGVRSNIAHRVLSQAGFDSASLSGGMLTLRAALGATADDLLISTAPAASTESSSVA
ncbi:FAD-dependent oxidoreductase [Isoptericola sediminis]|uniref:FAD-dependent oxidoreductase n=1 Tax=Isoptericola sediminis TaxID=2733572 RepID=A0A849K4M7_9MICO|nr:FAD-dependent oxidoreductase [Isoptericola sediminis]NNU26745.1 FAD-dependent oxidoreductase [Isoptericola sediminis]